jgi:pre-rRNA-processing protein TSR1
LVDQNPLDPLDAEQTWPTDEEIDQANSMIDKNILFFVELVQEQNETKKKRVPKGTSSYQAAWILEDDAEGEEVDSDEDKEMIPDFENDQDNSDEESDEEYEDVELDNRSVKFDALDDEANEEQ